VTFTDMNHSESDVYELTMKFARSRTDSEY